MSVTIKLSQKAYKKDFQTMTLDKFEEFRDEEGREHMHEILQGPVVPYFDIEKVFESEDDYKKHRVQTLLAALDDIKKAYPKGKQILFDASGFNISKDAWYLSTHVLVRGAGKYNSPKDVKAVVKTFRTPVFDDGVYAEGKSNRMTMLDGLSMVRWSRNVSLESKR